MRAAALALLLALPTVPVAARPGVASLAPAPSFEDLGWLPSRSPGCTPNGVSGDGSVVVGRCRRTHGVEAFRWTAATGTRGIGPGRGAVPSEALAVSDDGDIVVGEFYPRRHHPDILGNPSPFRWRRGRGLARVGGRGARSALDVSADGTVWVGYVEQRGLSRAVLWRGGGRRFLFGAGLESFASGVSADGSVVVGWVDGQAFRWSEPDGSLGLGSLGTGSSWATAVSADGSVVVGSSDDDGVRQAFRWTSETAMVALGSLPGGTTANFATDVSRGGERVVGYAGLSPESERAFLWTEADGMRDLATVLSETYGLDLTGWILREATAISDDGKVIVGEGTGPDGSSGHAWRAVLP